MSAPADVVASVKSGFDWKLVVKIFVVIVIINGVVDLLSVFGQTSAISANLATFMFKPFSYLKLKFQGASGN